MKSISTKHDSSQPVTDTAVYLFDDWFDPIEAAVRDRCAASYNDRRRARWNLEATAIRAPSKAGGRQRSQD
jgi:hypothetical protein